jgi:CO dehydrogenase nickel-insertion accessory protein CooC1
MITTTDRKHLNGQKIGVLGKGGAGKSTVVVLLAQALLRAGYTVCILDADSTNIGLNRALGLERPPAPLIEYFGGMVFSGGSVTCPVDDPSPLDGADVSPADLPAEYVARIGPRLYFLSAGKLGGEGAGAGCDGPIAKIARDLRLRGDAEPVVTLVDFKAGIEDSARGVVIGFDQVVVVVDPTQASLFLAGHLKQMVDGLRAGRLPATAHLERSDLVVLANRLYREARLQGACFVLNRFPTERAASYAIRLLADDGIDVSGIIRPDPEIAEAWLTGASISLAGPHPDVEAIVEALEAAALEPSVTG